MDFNAVNAAAEGYREDMVKFLRPCQNSRRKCRRRQQNCASKSRNGKLGFDKIDIDPQGIYLVIWGLVKN